MLHPLSRAVAAVATALVVTASAHATVIDFETPIDSPYAPYAPLLTNNDEFDQGNYWIDTFSTKSGASDDDLVGAIVDGSDIAGTCVSVSCPTNDASSFLTVLNDGYLALGTLDGSTFTASSLDASFIAASDVTVPETSLVLRVVGYLGNTVSFIEDFDLPGPSDGGYAFATYRFSAASAATAVTELDIYGYACTSSTTCTRALDQAQFALDNITLVDAATAVPEPSTYALLAAGFAGLAAARRRSRRRA